MDNPVGQEPIEARVKCVVSDVRRPFAVAESSLVSGDITFTLTDDNSVWQEDDYPTLGTHVALSELRRNDKGWRALNARYWHPTDEGE